MSYNFINGCARETGKYNSIYDVVINSRVMFCSYCGSKKGNLVCNKDKALEAIESINNKNNWTLPGVVKSGS